MIGTLSIDLVNVASSLHPVGMWNAGTILAQSASEVKTLLGTQWEVKVMCRLKLLVFLLVIGLVAPVARTGDYSPLFAAQLEATLTSWEKTYDDAREEAPQGDDLAPSVVPPWSICLGSVCIGSGCFGSICLGSGCSGSTCLGSACLMSGCVISGCVPKTLCLRECGDNTPPMVVDPTLPGSATVCPVCPES